MKHLKMLGLATVAATAMTAFTAGSASATTLEVSGTAKAGSVATTVSLKSETSGSLKTTGGLFINTCTGGSGTGSTASPFTGTAVGGPPASAAAASCTEEGGVIKTLGSVKIEHIGSSTNGTVVSSGAEATVPSAFGTLTCKTGEGTDIGTLTGSASGQAILDIKGVINCGLIPSAATEATAVVTSPEGLGVVS